MLAVGSELSSMVKIPRLREGLLGRAAQVFLGVAAVCSLVLALSFVLRRDLHEVHDRLVALSEEASDLQLALSMANDLILDLAVPHGGSGPDDAAIADWRSRLEELAEIGAGFSDTRSSLDHAAIQEALVGLEEVLAWPLPAEDADELVARLIPALRGFSAEVRRALSRVQEARLRLIREDERKADFGALAMLCVGFAGLTVGYLMTARFFPRLSRDARRVDERAERITGGGDGEPLGFEREDEVGELAEAVDAMARAFPERTREVEDARRHLLQGEKMFALGKFARGIAHEIANLLHSIMVICEHMDDSLAEDPTERNAAKQRKRLRVIVERLGRMNSALRDFSDFASPVPVEMAPMSVNSALESAIQLLHFDPRFRGISLTANLSRDVQMVYGATSQLTQVATNLLINAVDAIDGEGGAIVVTSAPDRDGVLITIEDNGHGMSGETCGKALNAFFTTKPRGEGTGLGLTVCKAIVDEHRGTLSIDSEAGRGTRVQIRLPCMPEEGTP